MRFRYEGLARFFKGNTHIHTTGSDGEWSPQEAIARYQDAGYDFLAVSDHNVVTRLQDRSTDSLCLIDSVEIDREDPGWRTRHVVCVGVGPTFPDRSTFPRMLAAARRDNAITCLAHPHWSGNTISQALRGRFHGVEVFNGVCFYLNHREDGAFIWDEALRGGADLFAFAADDNHGRPPDVKQYDLGWIMVAAARLERESILAAIRDGRFYASTGPTIHSIQFAGGQLTVRCSPVLHIWLNGPTWVSRKISRAPGQPIEEHTFDMAPMLEKLGPLPYLRLEIQDEAGKRAWTNKLFV